MDARLSAASFEEFNSCSSRLHWERCTGSEDAGEPGNGLEYTSVPPRSCIAYTWAGPAMVAQLEHGRGKRRQGGVDTALPATARRDDGGYGGGARSLAKGYAQHLTTRFGDSGLAAYPARRLAPMCPPQSPPSALVLSPGERGFGVGDGRGGGDGGGCRSTSVARAAANSTASARILRGGTFESINAGSRPLSAGFPSCRKPPPPRAPQGVGDRG